MNTHVIKTGLASIALIVSIGTTAISGGTDKTKKVDIVETAVAAGTFKTLATALTEAGLIETLKGKGPYTVFAPTDEAFAKIPEKDLKNLLKDKEELTRVLLYHVVAGEVMAADVVNLKTAKTVEGNEAKITVKDKTVMVDNATVVATDIRATNGIIHVIDSVILPPAKKDVKTQNPSKY
jgi:uncharacterized surface protein with fasciclin (FAS1) repeats